jgi:hypothetical protein
MAFAIICLCKLLSNTRLDKADHAPVFGDNTAYRMGEGSLVKFVELLLRNQPVSRRVMGLIPSGGALEVWPWTWLSPKQSGWL